MCATLSYVGHSSTDDNGDEISRKMPVQPLLFGKGGKGIGCIQLPMYASILKESSLLRPKIRDSIIKISWTSKKIYIIWICPPLLLDTVT